MEIGFGGDGDDEYNHDGRRRRRGKASSSRQREQPQLEDIPMQIGDMQIGDGGRKSRKSMKQTQNQNRRQSRNRRDEYHERDVTSYRYEEADVERRDAPEEEEPYGTTEEIMYKRPSRNAKSISSSSQLTPTPRSFERRSPYKKPTENDGSNSSGISQKKQQPKGRPSTPLSLGSDESSKEEPSEKDMWNNNNNSQKSKHKEEQRRTSTPFPHPIDNEPQEQKSETPSKQGSKQGSNTSSLSTKGKLRAAVPSFKRKSKDQKKAAAELKPSTGHFLPKQSPRHPLNSSTPKSTRSGVVFTDPSTDGSRFNFPYEEGSITNKDLIIHDSQSEASSVTDATFLDTRDLLHEKFKSKVRRYFLSDIPSIDDETVLDSIAEEVLSTNQVLHAVSRDKLLVEDNCMMSLEGDDDGKEGRKSAVMSLATSLKRSLGSGKKLNKNGESSNLLSPLKQITSSERIQSLQSPRNICISPTKSRSLPSPTSGERLSAYESYDIEEVASPYEKILCSKGNNLESLKNIASSVRNQGRKGGNMLFNAETGTIVTADMEESGDESASYSETESESDDSDDDQTNVDLSVVDDQSGVQSNAGTSLGLSAAGTTESVLSPQSIPTFLQSASEDDDFERYSKRYVYVTRLYLGPPGKGLKMKGSSIGSNDHSYSAGSIEDQNFMSVEEDEDLKRLNEMVGLRSSWNAPRLSHDLGLRFEEVTASDVEHVMIGGTTVARVRSVVKGSNADQMGVKEGDFISVSHQSFSNSLAFFHGKS